MKILIVDDNSDDLTLLQHIVERNGHDPIKAQNGKEALSLAASQMPDLIISDALMPVMDGFVFLKKLKEDDLLRSIPFIFYSATYQEDKDVALAKRLGACAYIFKPKDPTDLWTEVEQTLSRCQQETQVSSNVLKEEEVEYFEQYSKVVATKLEEKVLELEKALRQGQEAEEKLKEQSKFLQNALDALTHPFYVINVKDYTIIMANKASQFQEHQEGTTCYQLTHGGNKPCSGKNHPCTIAEIMKNKEHVVLEHIHTDEDGRKRNVEVHGYPVFGVDGEIIQVIEYCMDVTAETQLKEHLQQAQKMEAIGTLAGGIAHDFNNILSAILGYSEMTLADLPEGSKLWMQQEQVVIAGHRAKNLVQQILTFSRQTKEAQIPVHTHYIVKEAINLLRSSIPTTIEIKQNIDSGAGMVMADPTQIHQIVMNLCTNAYHAMRDKGGTLNINLAEVQIEKNNSMVLAFDLIPGSYIKLEVSDTGCGMGKEIVDKIYEPYFTTKTKGEGTGLGLSMVHGIVKSYAGHISVTSQPGVGTTFTVYIPRIKIEQNNALIERTECPHGTERILILDDELTLVELQKRMLESIGYKVSTFTNSEKALKKFQSAPDDFDLIITDMTMPGMRGDQLSQRLIAIRPDIPVILCTGYSEFIDKENAAALGIRDYLMKPISKNALAVAVRKVLDEGASLKKSPA